MAVPTLWQTVAPENPVNYVFSIESEHGPGACQLFLVFWFPSERDPVLEPLKLVIVYRILHEGTSSKFNIW